MKARSSNIALKRKLTVVWSHWRQGRYDRALEEVNRLLESRSDNAQLLVLRAALIQLQDDEEGTPPLDAARADLELAVSLDERSLDALIDLAYFQHAVDDDPKAAIKQFQKAVKLGRALLKKALIGQAEALAELQEETRAAECLIEAYHLAASNGKSDVKDILERLESLRQSD